jgi:hypothetical protein
MELTGLGRSLGTRATLRPGCPSVKRRGWTARA